MGRPLGHSKYPCILANPGMVNPRLVGASQAAAFRQERRGIGDNQNAPSSSSQSLESQIWTDHNLLRHRICRRRTDVVVTVLHVWIGSVARCPQRQPYQSDELKFAWCYRVFFRWRTWPRVPVPWLAGLTAESFNPRLEQYQVRLLEFGSDSLDMWSDRNRLPIEYEYESYFIASFNNFVRAFESTGLIKW